MKSLATATNKITLPEISGEFSMIPFNLDSLKELPEQFKRIAKQMLKGVDHKGGVAFFTFHGKQLKKNQTLRRGAPHTDGSYDLPSKSWGGGGGGCGWKIGENGPPVDTDFHKRLYNSESGGIILASNFESCLGWLGEFEGLPNVGGDCRHIELNKPFMLEKDTVYYGNNHFIHESLPVSEDVFRVFARITMPEDHEYTQ